MAKPNRSNGKNEPGNKFDKKINDRWEKDKEAFDQYCPTCREWYPASSNAHAGH